MRYGQHTRRVLAREYFPPGTKQGKQSGNKRTAQTDGAKLVRLYSSLAAEQQDNLEKYDDCINEIHCLIELEIFSYAFRLGGRLMLATLTYGGENT